DHPDPRLDEEHPVEAAQGGGSHREPALPPQLQGQQVHQRDAQRPEDAAHDPPAEGVEAQVGDVSPGALEHRPVGAVEPLTGRDWNGLAKKSGMIGLKNRKTNATTRNAPIRTRSARSSSRRSRSHWTRPRGSFTDTSGASTPWVCACSGPALNGRASACAA